MSMQYEIKQGQTIYDVATLLYGSATLSVKILSDNLQLQNLDNNNLANVTIIYDANYVSQLPTPIEINKPDPINNIPAYIIKNGQSIYDLAVQLGYTLDKVSQMFVDFPQLQNLDNTEIANISLNVTNKRNKLADYLNLNNIVLSTGLTFGAGKFIVDNEGDLLGGDNFVLVYT